MRRSKKASKLRITGLVRAIHRSPMDSPHKGPVTQKMFSFDDVIMLIKANIFHIYTLIFVEYDVVYSGTWSYWIVATEISQGIFVHLGRDIHSRWKDDWYDKCETLNYNSLPNKVFNAEIRCVSNCLINPTLWYCSVVTGSALCNRTYYRRVAKNSSSAPVMFILNWPHPKIDK